MISHTDPNHTTASPKDEHNPVAAAAFASGAVGLFFLSGILGPLAVILGVVGLANGKGVRYAAVTGLILGVVDVLWAVASFYAALGAARGY